MTEELFDTPPKQLYEATGGKPGKRETLPKPAQKAFIAGDTVADFDLKEQDIQGNSTQKNEQIVDSVRKSGKKVRRWLPW